MSHLSSIKLAAGIVVCAFSTAAAAANLDKADVEFMHKAAQSGQLEIQASQQAEQSASSVDVKNFAQRMVKDHTQVAQELQTLATNKGVQLPADMSKSEQSKIADLSKLKGHDFDKKYAKEIGVSAHKDAVKLFDKASKHAKDADVKSFAQKTLPTLKEHLDMAEAMSKSVKKQ